MRGEQPDEAAAVGRLHESVAVAAGRSDLDEPVEQHGLSDAAQSGREQALRRPAEFGALEFDREGAQFGLAADQGRRRGPGARAVGVADLVHDARVNTVYSSFVPNC